MIRTEKRVLEEINEKWGQVFLGQEREDKRMMRYLRKGAYCAPLALSVLLATANPTRGAEARPAWQVDWERTLQEARKEGQVTIYRTNGPYDPLFREFSQRYPEIRIVGVSGRGSQLAPRIMAERRAEKYLVDLYLGAPGTPYRVLYQAKILEPISPLLVLPEVVDPSRWFQGKHHYADPEERSIFVFEGTLRSEVAYNKNLVDPKEFRSFWDLLDPKWKGKMGAVDPRKTGVATSSALAFFYHHPELGPDYLRRLFGAMALSFTADPRQLTDWLSVGKVAIAFFVASDAAAARKQGLPVEVFPPTAFKEGTYGSPRQGSVSVLERAPHPNAAKVFVNWLLSREGQFFFQKHFTVPEEEYLTSFRLDIPKEDIPASYRLVEGIKYLPIYRPELIDSGAARKVVEEALGANKSR